MILDKISTNNFGIADAFCRAYRFKLQALFSQFYLQDELAEGEVNWTTEECENKLALSLGIIAVATACDRVVPVEVQILAAEPQRNLGLWDHMIECSIDVGSGKLVVFG